MADISLWIDSAVRYLQERGKDHIGPALCMFGVQLALILCFMLGYVPFFAGVLLAEKYAWAPLVGGAVGFAIFMFATAVLQPVHLGYLHGTFRSMRGEGFPLSEFAWGFKRLPAALGLFIATMGAVFLGTLFCYIPGLIVGLLLGLASPALADRDAGVMDALGTSFDLVRSNFWAMALWWLLMMVVLMVAAFVPVIGSMLTIPLASILQATAYLYLTKDR